MSQIALIGLGSNIDPIRHLRAAAMAIRLQYPDAVFSNVYRSRPVGMSGEDFLNACCCVRTTLGLTALTGWLKSLERAAGRASGHGSWEPRTLDLDLLMLGERIVDEGLFRYAHVHVPASELVDISIASPGGEQVRIYSSLTL